MGFKVAGMPFLFEYQALFLVGFMQRHLLSLFVRRRSPLDRTSETLPSLPMSITERPPLWMPCSSSPRSSESIRSWRSVSWTLMPSSASAESLFSQRTLLSDTRYPILRLYPVRFSAPVECEKGGVSAFNPCGCSRREEVSVSLRCGF